MGQNGNGEREIKIRIPDGMDPRFAQAIFQQLFNELHELEPLARNDAKMMFAQGLLNDYPALAAMRKKIVEAPAGSMWGVSFIEPPNVVVPGAEPAGFHIEAYTKMREAKEAGLEAALKTVNCYALLTSATARGLLAMHGYRLQIRPPYVPEMDVPDDQGTEG